ncbi:MAG: hypothetical protein OXL68_21685 [Paracoccaceae bacterium]|nr:hypothetical protein [Paracoccaceae bacterium]
MTLPTSLTVPLLEQILNYVPSHRRKILTDLQQQFQVEWGTRSSSDENFYSYLHSFVQDPVCRKAFNEIARKHSTKRRSLDLFRAILAYYMRQCPELRSEFRSSSTPVEFLEFLAQADDVDCLANITWAFLEDGQIDIDVLQQLSNDYPELSDRFDYTSRKQLALSPFPWREAVKRLANIVSTLDPNVPNISIANRLYDEASRLRTIADAERSRFWADLRSLFTQFAKYVDDNDDLQRIKNESFKLQSHGFTPNNSEVILAKIENAFVQYKQQHDAIQEASEKLSMATIESRKNLINVITKSNDLQQKAIHSVQKAIHAIGQVDSPVTSPNEAEKVRNLPEENTVGSPNPHFGERVPTGIMEQAPTSVQDGRDESGSHTSMPESTLNADSRDSRSESDHCIEEPPFRNGKTVPVDKVPPVSVSSPSTDRPQVSATQLVNELLSEGQFAQAYWIARASQSFDPNVLGALCEGALLTPGSSCPGLLAHFFDELTSGKEWTDDERLLMVAAILQPVLFLRTYPESLYQLVSTAPATPLTGVLDRFRKTYLSQGITLGPQTIQPNVQGAEVADQLHRVADDAEDFLARLPSIRFGYQPAENALRHLYGPKTSWRRLHEIIGNKQYGRTEEVSAIIQGHDPKAVVATVHNRIPGLRQQLVGHPRDKLKKHLHDSIALGTEWLDLVERQRNSRPKRQEKQERELKATIISELRQALPNYENSPDRTAGWAATWFRLTDLLQFLTDGTPKKAESIGEACLELPGIRLSNDLTPSMDDNKAVVHAMQELRRGSVQPQSLFSECLDRDEFVRARRVLERHELGQDSVTLLLQKRDTRCIELRRRLSDLHSKVEESFLLGQLWSSGEETQARTNLLSLVNVGLAKLGADDVALDTNVGEAAKTADLIDSQMADVTANQLSYLKAERKSLGERFQDTERGRSDRQYFERSFSECLESEDHITAFDLLDRARRAVDQGEPIARSPFIASSEHLRHFLEFAENNRESLGRGLRRFCGAIRKGDTVLGIPFGQLDRARRDDAIKVLNGWGDLRAAAEVECVCQFLGFPVVENCAQLGKRSGDGLFHVDVQLSHVGPVSPLPGFGSLLESHLDVVVVTRSQEPEQISAFLNEIGVRDGKAAVVLLTRPISNQFRVKWLRECVASRSMALPLDSCLLMYLCGQRNRLQALLDVGLPHTWAQPYITKGETVAREMFVGRQAEAQDIIDRNGSCIVFGGRQLGKSALLTHARRENHSPSGLERLFVAYLDVNDLGEPQTAEEMIDTFWKRVSECLSLEGAIEASSLPVSRGKRSRWADHVPNAVSASLTVDQSRRIVLLLDETDKMLDLDSQRDFALIRRLRILMANTERRFKVVLAGLQSVQRYYNWKNHPFAQLGREIVIDPLPPKAAEDLIVKPFRALGFEFDTSKLVCRILSMANYHPGLIQIFCYRLLTNLYKNHRQWQSITRTISADDILIIERDPSFREDVRNRFDWTLDLDDRYKVLTYGLVLADNPTTPKTATDFRELGISWWPGVFERLDAQAMRALLDEMVGLGVLLAEHQDDLLRSYRLRSPNLLRLLGPKETIEGELLRIVSSDRMTRVNPREFRSVIEQPARFGPLTKEQQGYLSDATDLFSLVLVLGSAALGLREVGAQVREVMRSTSESSGALWDEISIPVTGGVASTNLLLDGLRRKLSPRYRHHRYAILNLEELVFDEDLGGFLKVLLQETKKLCRSNARRKVFVFLDPRLVWKWLCSDFRISIEEDPSVSVMALRRWTEGAVTNALDHVGSRTGSKAAGSGICKITAGMHVPISATMERVSGLRRQSGVSVTSIAEEVTNSCLASDKIGVASLMGLSDDRDALRIAATELFRWSSLGDDGPVLTEDSFSCAQDAFDPGTDSRKLLTGQRAALLEWLRALDLVWANGTNDQELCFPPLLSKLVDS